MALLPKDIIRLVQVMNIQFLCHLSTAASSGISFAGDAILPNVPRDVYAMPGDINIGLTMDIHEHADKSGCVGDIRPGSWAIEYPEAVAFAVDMVNKNPKLIPRATLGFYLLDDCADRRYVMAHGLTFLPRNNLICIPALCHDSVCDRNICGISSWPYIPSLSKAYTEQPVPHYDVIGILAPPLSKLTISLSNLLSLSKIPIIGFLASTDELSDKTLHPHFLRVVTADKYQALAMLTFISANGWSFISVVYAKDPYGEGAFETILDSVGSFNICIATSHRVTSDNDMNSVAKDLLNYPRARVVILFIYDNMAINLFESIETFNATGHFIWICCDAVSRAGKKVLSQYMDNVVGAFFLGYDTVTVFEFYEHIRRQNPTMSPNPWFKQAWENTFKCSFADGNCNTTADITGSSQFGFEGPPSKSMDAVLAFAHGIHNLLSDQCPNANGKAARDCIKRDTLLQYLDDVSFKGFSGHIKFDNNYDYYGKFIIYQMAYDYLSVQDKHGKLRVTNSKGLVSKTVAVFDSSLSLLTYTDEGIRWDHLLKTERVVPLPSNTSIPEVPESVCSRPCVPPEYMIKKKFDCCWDCQPCLSNEKLINGNTGCEVCEKFTWPDPETGFTTCRDIPPTYVSHIHTFSAIAIWLAVMGILATLLIATIFVRQREKPVIKSGSRELNAFQLSGILVGYITVIPFQTMPTPSLCTALYFMFWFSFTWLYSSLLSDVFRIYCIFQYVMKGVTLRRASTMSLIIMSSVRSG